MNYKLIGEYIKYINELSTHYRLLGYKNAEIGGSKYVNREFRIKMCRHDDIQAVIQNFIEDKNPLDGMVYVNHYERMLLEDKYVLYVSGFIEVDPFENHKNHKTLLQGLGEI